MVTIPAGKTVLIRRLQDVKNPNSATNINGLINVPLVLEEDVTLTLNSAELKALRL